MLTSEGVGVNMFNQVACILNNYTLNGKYVQFRLVVSLEQVSELATLHGIRLSRPSVPFLFMFLGELIISKG